MKEIFKHFGTVTALKNVNFNVQNNEIVGLVGDNGAGKSTLIKILTGVFPPDKGEILFEGKKINLSSPKIARDLGIETVHQNLALIDLMSIARNFFLGREPVKNPGGIINILDKDKIENVTEKALKDIGINVRSIDEEVSV